MRYSAAILGCVLAAPALAQTRMWLPSSGVAAVSPAFSAGWEDTGSADRMAIAVVSGGATPPTNKTALDATTTIDTDLLVRQYVSPPFNGAQTISGTAKGQVKVSESNNPLNARAQLVIYVVSHDGSTVRGVLLDFDASPLSSEFSTSNVSRKFPLAAISPATLSSVSASDCDRLVVEYGSRNHSTGTGSTINMIFGDNNSVDLSESEGATINQDPWLEISGPIAFRSEGACGAVAERRVMVIGS